MLRYGYPARGSPVLPFIISLPQAIIAARQITPSSRPHLLAAGAPPCL